VNDMRQQSHGLYGPIIVLGPGQRWDPSSDLVFMAGTNPINNAVHIVGYCISQGAMRSSYI